MGVVTVSAAYGAAGAEIAPAVAEQLGPALPRPGDPRAGGRPAGGHPRGGRGQRRDRRPGAVAAGRLARDDARPGRRRAPDVDAARRARLPAADRAGARRDRRRRRRRGARPGRGAGARGPAGRAARPARRPAASGGWRRPCGRSGRPLEEVRREMEANDRTREAYVRHFYRCDPAEAQHYHLVVDSTALAGRHGRRPRGDGGPQPRHREPLT